MKGAHHSITCLLCGAGWGFSSFFPGGLCACISARLGSRVCDPFSGTVGVRGTEPGSCCQGAAQGDNLNQNRSASSPLCRGVWNRPFASTRAPWSMSRQWISLPVIVPGTAGHSLPPKNLRGLVVSLVKEHQQAGQGPFTFSF